MESALVTSLVELQTHPAFASGRMRRRKPRVIETLTETRFSRMKRTGLNQSSALQIALGWYNELASQVFQRVLLIEALGVSSAPVFLIDIGILCSGLDSTHYCTPSRAGDWIFR